MPRLRPAREDDHDLYLRLFAELGVDDPPAGVDRWRRELMGSTFVLEDGGRAVGYALVQLLPTTGYLRQIVVDRGARRRGLGRFTMSALAQHLGAAGCRRWCLNVKPDNGAAVGLYRSLGLVERHRSVSVRLRWSSIEGLSADGIRCAELVAARTRDAERRFDLPEGLLEAAVARSGIVSRIAHRGDALRGDPGDALVGLACFDPALPGCFPFRAEDASTAVALFCSLRAHADPDVGHLQVVIEAAPWLVVELEKIGAWRVLELAHYAGEIE